MTITEALDKLQSLLSVRDLGEKIVNDLTESWWVIALFLSGKLLFIFAKL